MSFIQVPPDSSGKKVLHKQHVVGPDTVQAQTIHVASGMDPNNIQTVDRYGAALTAFADGQPTLDATGQLRVAASSVLGAYDFVSGPQDSLFGDTIAGGGTVTHLPQRRQMLLSTGTASGDEATRMTLRYHYYLPGTGVLALFNVVCGDAGKANNVREWGMGDALNGVMFVLIGTAMNVRVRSNATGSVVDTLIPQSSWNRDKCDGTGVSGYTLQHTARNLYWIDFLWLGAGAVRFGVFGPGGDRITCHIAENTGVLDTTPYMARASLPLTVSNRNTGVTTSGSEMYYTASAIYSEAQANYVFWRYADLENPAPKTITTDTPLLSVRSTLVAEGNVNRVQSYPETIAVFVTGGAMKLTLHTAPDLVGDTWAGTSSTLEADYAATALGLDPGGKMFTFYLDEGAHTLDLRGFFELNDVGISLEADGTTRYPWSFVCTKLSGATVTAQATLTYRELS